MNEVGNRITSLLEEGFLFNKKGIIVDHDLVVRGVVSTRLVCLKTVEIEEKAVVNGDVFANDVIVKGAVNGNIYAKSVVKLCQSGTVRGKIYYGNLEVEKLAVLTGSSERVNLKKIEKYFEPFKTAKAGKEVKPATAKPAAKTELKPAVKPVAKPVAKPAAKVETKPETKPVTKTEVKPVAKIEAKPEAKPEVKLDIKPAAPKAAVKPLVVKPTVAKISAKPEEKQAEPAKE